MPRLAQQDRPGAPPRILLDLVEGQLDDAELEAVAAWLAADPVEPPGELIECAIGVRPHLPATV